MSYFFVTLPYKGLCTYLLSQHPSQSRLQILNILAVCKGGLISERYLLLSFPQKMCYPQLFNFNDLSIASTKTKSIELNTKTQNIFCRLNENLTTFLYALTGTTGKQKEKKVFSFKVYTKVEC